MQLDPQLRALLASLRRQVRQYIVIDSLLAVAAFVLGAFWLGWLLDYVPVRLGGTEMPRSARTVLLLVTLAVALVILANWLVGRLSKPLRDDSLALLLERQHPQLGGRLVTAVQLTQADRQHDLHEPALLQRVHAEAAAAVDQIEAKRVFRREPLWQKASLLIPMLLALLVFAVASPQSLALATSRLLLFSDSPWPRQADLLMVGVELPAVVANENDATPPKLIEFVDQVARLPQGSSGTLRIAARANDAIVPDVCTVYYTSEDGTRGQANMRRVGRVVDGLQSFVLDGPPLAGLTESVRLDVRGLDARLDDFRIEAVPPPAISQMLVAETDPVYLKPRDADLPSTREVAYQSGLRVREGSTVQLRGSSTTQLRDVDVFLVRGNEPKEDASAVVAADGKSFVVSIDDMREPATIVVVPADRTGITAQVPYRYFLGVVIDNAPELSVRLKGIGTAVTPVAKLPIRGTATDDYEIDSAKVELALVAAPPPDDATVEPRENGIAKLEEPPPGTVTAAPITLDRDGNFDLTIDLKAQTESKQFIVPDPQAEGAGAAINLFAEVSDRYDLKGKHVTKSELIRLEVVTAEKLLMLLERRELALRARLEQSIEETRTLRDSLDTLRREIEVTPAATTAFQATAQNGQSPGDTGDGEDPTAGRSQQIFRLRTQQNGLQASKTSEELSGIAASLDDLLEEMQNNRVDSIDRSEQIGQGVRDPLRLVVSGDLAKLRSLIAEAEGLSADPTEAAAKTGQAVETAEEVLLQLTAILEKMLDLESYNEILDMLRELIESQEGLLDETKKEQKRKIQDLFNSVAPSRALPIAASPSFPFVPPAERTH